jgi:CRP/FNR family transcriptional regulator, anaerobic regulatory protein
MAELLDFLASLDPLTDALEARLREIIKEKEIARKNYLLKSGRICDNIYYVKEGLFRLYYYRGKKDITSAFIREGNICVDFESYTTQGYSEMNIQALENSLVQYFSREQLEKTYRDFPAFNLAGRILTEKCLLLKMGWVKEMWMRKAFDRYKWFIQNYAELADRVRGKYLASYLGITEGMLSRLKKNQD